MLFPDHSKVIAIPICTVCKNRISTPGTCKIFGTAPEPLCKCITRECAYAELDTNALFYEKFLLLYPDEFDLDGSRKEKK